MKIAFVTPYDVTDITKWSGSPYYIVKALKESGFEIEVVGNLWTPWDVFFKGKKLLLSIILSKSYLRDREPIALKSYAKKIERALTSINPDVIFSPGTKPIAYLQTGIPIVFWTDATFAGMVNFYSDFTSLCDETISKGNQIEQAALSNCRLAIYASNWAASTAIANYEVNPNKIKVVPFGANHDLSYRLSDIQEWAISKGTDVCKLLFVGSDWERKGGKDALSVAEVLNSRGLKTELHIVGCKPPIRVPHYVRIHGFLSKMNDEERNLLDQLFKTAHFLLVPSRAECYGVVFAEASSYGLPSLSTNVGGISTAIADDLNGRTFYLENFVQECSNYILEIMSSKEKYDNLSTLSFIEYNKRLNWRSAGESVAKLIYEYCK
jgi:glycosyltransferase involved in cell wall biosynthesis